jgi:hypothetical protein
MPAFFLPGRNGWRDGKPASMLVPRKWPHEGKPPKVQKVPYTEEDDATLARWVAEHGETRASFTRAVEAGHCHGHNMESIRSRWRNFVSRDDELLARVKAEGGHGARR